MEKDDITAYSVSTDQREQGWLTGSCLISMPSMMDPRFRKSVIFICSHDAEGAMGLVINRAHDDVTFKNLCTKLKLECETGEDIPILCGGPVEIGRGFVLHRSHEEFANSLNITPDIGLCATMDALQGLAQGNGPPNARVALGYAGWGAGQLEEEIVENSWLVCDCDADMLLKMTPVDIYDAALARLGVELASLATETGHA